VTARPPKHSAQLRSVSHSLVSLFAEAPVKNVKTDAIWPPTLQGEKIGGEHMQRFVCG